MNTQLFILIRPERTRRQAFAVIKVGILRVIGPGVTHRYRVRNRLVEHNNFVILYPGFGPVIFTISACYGKAFQIAIGIALRYETGTCIIKAQYSLIAIHRYR